MILQEKKIDLKINVSKTKTDTVRLTWKNGLNTCKLQHNELKQLD